MAIFAISDLHLSFGTDKPMNVFGQVWENYEDKIKINWKSSVNENDIVRAGDAIALGGNTGRSTGPHLHFETRFLGQAINPAEIIDFERCEPIKPQYVFRNIKIKGRKSNIYTSSDQNIVFHRVRSGDNLSVIAKKYGTTVSQLCRLNGITTKTIIRPGQSLRLIPSGSYKK